MRNENTDLPVKAVRAWADGKGQLYATKEAALHVEIQRVLGHVGNDESLAPGIARLLVENRDRLIPLLQAFEADSDEIIEAIPLPPAPEPKS